MKSNDIEWRKAIREHYGISNLMPDAYTDLWKTQTGRRIAFKIVFRRVFIDPIKKILTPILLRFSLWKYNYGQSLCARGLHKFAFVSEEVSMNSHSKLITKSCTRCQVVKRIRR